MNDKKHEKSSGIVRTIIQRGCRLSFFFLFPIYFSLFTLSTFISIFFKFWNIFVFRSLNSNFICERKMIIWIRDRNWNRNWNLNWNRNRNIAQVFSLVLFCVVLQYLPNEYRLLKRLFRKWLWNIAEQTNKRFIAADEYFLSDFEMKYREKQN